MSRHSSDPPKGHNTQHHQAPAYFASQCVRRLHWKPAPFRRVHPVDAASAGKGGRTTDDSLDRFSTDSIPKAEYCITHPQLICLPVDFNHRFTSSSLRCNDREHRQCLMSDQIIARSYDPSMLHMVWSLKGGCYILGLIAGLSPLSLRFVGLRGDLMISDALANADW
eukprot:COSAG02_NODE_6856_length_3324_cov_155.239070_4_plen_167_part_00